MRSNNIQKILFSLLILILINPSTLFGGEISDAIKEYCPKQYCEHTELVDEYSIRMEDYIYDFGCEVINIYATFVEENMDLIELLEENNDLMEATVDLFESIPKIIPVFQKNPKILNSLLLLKKIDLVAFIKLKETLQLLSPYELRQMEKEPRYFLYVLLTSMIVSVNDECSSDIIKLMKKLKKRVSVNNIEMYALLFNFSGEIYPDVSMKKRMKYVEMTLGIIGEKTLRKIRSHQQYLFYFLPPDTHRIVRSQELSSAKIETIQHDYIDLVKFIFKFFAGNNLRNINNGLFMTEVISEHILDALRYYNNCDEIKKYLKYQFKSPVFSGLFIPKYCDIEYQKKIRLFFSMYSPAYDNQGLKEYGEDGNLGRIAEWFKFEIGKKFIRMAKPIDWYRFSCCMANLPKIYFDFNDKQKKAFNDLLFKLSDDPVVNGLFLIGLSQKSNFFDWVKDSDDAFTLIHHNSDDKCGQTSPKYRYILTTSFPSDYDFSIFRRFQNNDKIDMSTIYHLIEMDCVTLHTHNFTKTEVAMKIYDNIDNTITILQIAAIPVTAGLSVAVGSAVKYGLRKSAKIIAKKTMKILYRKGAKSVIRLVRLGSKAGRKVAWREFKVLTGWAAKRGRKTIQHSMIKNIDKIDDVVGYSNLAAHAITFSTAFFLSQSVVETGLDDLCPDQKNQ